MSTPLAKISKLLSPNVLKSVSPTFLKVPTPQRSLRQASRCLDFTKTPTKQSNIKITINDEQFVLNTPQKNNILREGCINEKFNNILGRGTFGTVIKGIFKGEIVAMKIVKNSSDIREKNCLNLPKHENIVKILDILMKTQENYAIIVMEYENDCIQLQTIINDQNFDLKPLEKQFALDICNGLQFCHESNLLHLDLKPGNVLVSGGKCKICDFGNSFRLNEDFTAFKHNGTLIYTAPEILLGLKPTEKSDIFSFGIILWQLKHRRTPYDKYDNNQTIIYQVVKRNLRPDCDLMLENEEYYKLLCMCWSEMPENRPNIYEIHGKLLEI